ncbi:MAG TPA: ABC transporter permease [Candidatus Anaerostipes excrementavium]|uniref:ABC transporter permease n=1 Tax=Candidatus Anaerostipes excrementavium TaxID=2838463 RepID=A0A9D2B810_9FIRM|nr:ABC transporter permease [uncultured Anaerostipes sp.]HIX66685.1 ABC transporter permease [Candidatus Anaerostipes excrementavium]
MIQWIAFLRKEWMEFIRSGKLWMILVLCILFGITNPAIAKLTPWMLENFSGSFQELGITLGQVKVNAMTSWTQFDKNYSLFLILFLLLMSNILTAEYQKGTLIPIVTRGMKKWKILMIKLIMVLTIWIIGYWLCVLITFGYNAYFWGNQILSHLFSYWGCLFLAGLWVIFVLILASAYFSSYLSVCLFCAAEFAISYCLGMIGTIQKYVPSYLLKSSGLLTGETALSDYIWAIGVVIILLMIHMITALLVFRHKNLCT